MVSSKVGHDKLPKFLESKVRWKTRITQSRRGKWMWSPTDKKRRFIQALQYDNHALQMPQWSENLQSVLEAWGFSIHKVSQLTPRSSLGAVFVCVISPSKPNRRHLCWTTTSKYPCCCMSGLTTTPSIRAVPTSQMMPGSLRAQCSVLPFKKKVQQQRVWRCAPAAPTYLSCYLV